ncbi:ABC transporter ATP-binding protein [Streptomyces sp. NBC_01361]|uniref:ABC transporter ATP-binding protein n=1 Tax=Streptomyces sp. NBC_01361 TaxID=2903838 RepID=UPI002E363E11|nr:ABC transporter ATP-binding protein [Streptomyces sp. NBC_01361]
MIIEVDRLDVRYGATRALRDVSFELAEGEVVALIGANGAGKSSLLRALAGLETPRGGTIRLFGQDIGHAPAHEVARKGLRLVAEGRQLFTDLTVGENLWMGGYASPFDREEQQAQLERVFGLFPILREFTGRAAGMLSGGQQQMVAIGRALMGGPRALLLDEPSLGLAPKYVAQILEVICELAATGITVLLAEQNAAAALRAADRGIVLSNGTITHTSSAQELLDDEDVSRHYLGVGTAEDADSVVAPRQLPCALDRLEV